MNLNYLKTPLFFDIDARLRCSWSTLALLKFRVVLASFRLILDTFGSSWSPRKRGPSCDLEATLNLLSCVPGHLGVLLRSPLATMSSSCLIRDHLGAIWGPSRGSL